MSSTLSPNMSLIVPTVGNEPGPTYAQDINNSLAIIDQHNHSPGSGVQITPAGLNINTALTFNNNFANNVAGLTFLAQNSTPTTSTIYQSGNDLFFVDALGNNIQITANGGIAGSPGSISNLTSPASAAYVAVSKTFVWQSDVNIAANLDAASILLRNISPNSTFALTLAPPSALSSNYTLTLPTLPAQQNVLTLDSTGAIASVTWDAVGQNMTATGANAVGASMNSTGANAVAASRTRAVGTTVGLGGVAISAVSSGNTSGATNVVITSVTLTTSGRPVCIGVMGGNFGLTVTSVSGGPTSAVISINNTTLSTTPVQYFPSLSANGFLEVVPSCVSYIDTPVAGTYTYNLTVRLSSIIGHSGTIEADNVQLFAYEL